MRTQRTGKRVAVVVALCLAAAACEEEIELTANVITATNVPDQFTWSVTDLQNVSGGIQYLWTVTRPQIVVDVTESISSGDAIIQIRDFDGVVVYEHPAGNAVDDTTAVAEPGLWQVSVVVDKLHGGFSFTATGLDTLSTP